MKNHKHLIADFYLELLAIPLDDKFRRSNQSLYIIILLSLARELEQDEETVQRIFEAMAMEDNR